MGRTFVQKVAEEQAKLEARVRGTSSTSRLANASLEDTKLELYDRQGVPRGSFGKQQDGSYGSVVRNSPDQPTPSAPILPDDDEPVSSDFPVAWDGDTTGGAVPEVHGRVDVWTQQVEDMGEADFSAAVLSGSIRDRDGGATTIVVRGAGLTVVWLQMVGADRTTKSEPSAPSTVTVTSRVDAQDIEDRLNAFAEGELEDGAYENLLARLGEFMHVRADQIDVNSLAADAAFIGYLEAAGIVLSDEAGGRRFTVSGQGWRLDDLETGQPIAQLGLHDDDLLTLHDPETGDPTVNITGAGGLSAAHVSSQSDPHVGGKALAGRHYDSLRWHSSDSVVDYLPQGAHLWWRRVFEGETTTTGGAQAGINVAHLEAKILPGRLYRIKCHDFEMGDRTAYWSQAYLTTSDDPDVRPPRPTRETPSASLWGPRVPGRVPPSGSGNNTALGYEWLVTFPAAQWLRVIFTVGNSASTGNVFGSAFRNQALLSIEDLGPSTGPKGYDMLSGSMSAGETIPELPEDLSQSYGIQRTATYTLDLSTRTATRAYYDGTPRFGRWDGGTWYMSLAEFDSWSSQPGTRTRMDYSLAVSSWLNDGRGHIVQSAVPTFEGLPSSFNFDEELIIMPNQTSMQRWTPRTLTPEEEALEEALSRPAASIAVGRTGWGTISEGLPASGRLQTSTSGTFVRLSTELGGGSEDD